MSWQPTPEQRAFVEKYVPFLEDLVADPDKQWWFRDYMADKMAILLMKERHTPVANDRWGIGDTIHGEFVRDAYEAGLVPADYMETIDGARDADGGMKPLGQLSDYEVICFIAYFVRGDRFVEDMLLRAVMDGSVLTYMHELQRRWV